MKQVKEEQVAPHTTLTDYYQDEKERRQVVDDMFDSSAKHYDWINSMMSFGSGRWYRNIALNRAGMAKGMSVLDVGAGTGVVSHLAQEIVGPEGLVVALDPSKGMLAEAQKLGVINTTQGLGERLPFPDNTFDMVTMGYALRHVEDLKLLFSEFKRVLKPGGKILLLEITRPESAFGQKFLKFYMKGVIPTVTRIFRRSADAQKLMRYYWDTIEACVPPATIVSAMDAVGLTEAKRHLVQGIFSEYSAVKSSTSQ